MITKLIYAVECCSLVAYSLEFWENSNFKIIEGVTVYAINHGSIYRLDWNLLSMNVMGL